MFPKPFNCIFAALLAGLLSASCSLPNLAQQEEKKPEVSIAGIAFEKTKVSLAVGESAYIGLKTRPQEALGKVEIAWEWDREKLSLESDSNGAVLKGLKEGSTYIRAVAQGLSTTAIVTVQGFASHYEGESYLYANQSVIELEPGNRENFSLSLYGGSSGDLENITWEVGDESIAGITAARNNCLIEARKTGLTQVKARHPSAAYPYTLVVHVSNGGDSPAYLTTAQNIVTVRRTKEAGVELNVEVKNLKEHVNPALFSWNVVDEEGKSVANPPLSIKPAGKGGAAFITPLEDALSRVRVSYASCPYPLDILVNAVSTQENLSISLDSSTLIVDGSGAMHTIKAELEGDDAGFVDNSAFTWEVLDAETAQDLMEWTSAENIFTLTGRKNGVVKVKVRHTGAEYSRTVLIILRNQAGSERDASLYITTSSNYVQTKVGGKTVEVTVTLAGGLPGDEQDFIWKIDDEAREKALLETAHGIVSPSGVERSVQGSFCYGKLYISPLQRGSFTVEVGHPKVLYKTPLLVKVFSEYALLPEDGSENASLPAGGSVLAYLTSPVSVIRMLNNTRREARVSLRGNVKRGDENAIAWEVEDTAHITVNPSSGSSTILEARGPGVKQSMLTARHERSLNEKRIIVLSADTEEKLNAVKAIYSDATYYRMREGASVKLKLNALNLTAEDSSQLKWKTSRPLVATVEAGENRLEALVKALHYGRTIISAELKGVPPCTFDITVLPPDESLDVNKEPDEAGKESENGGDKGDVWTPPGHNAPEENPSTGKILSAYLGIKGPQVISVLAGERRSLTAFLRGRFAPEDINGVVWESSTPETVHLNPLEGESTSFTIAQGKGPQETYVRAELSKAENDAQVLILSADTEAQLKTMKAIYAEKSLVRLREGESARLILGGLNIDESDSARIQWSADDYSRVFVEQVPENRLQARVDGLKKGKTKVRARLEGCKEAVFTVIVFGKDEVIPELEDKTEEEAQEKDENQSQQELSLFIRGNKVEKLLNGSSKIVSAGLRGNSLPHDVNSIHWKSEDTNAVTLTPQEGESTLLSAPFSAGQHTVYVTASHDKALSEAKLLVLTADTQDELDRMQALWTEGDSYIRMREGEETSLVLSAYNIQESEKAQIKWKNSAGSIVSLAVDTQDRFKVQVRGRAPGKAVITASFPGCKDIVFTVIVVGQDEEILLNPARYLTTAQNAVHIPEVNGRVDIRITGVNIEPALIASGTRWEAADSSVIQVTANGGSATVRGLKEGRTHITVKNEGAAANTLFIEVKVGLLSEGDEKLPVYLETDVDVLRLVKGEERTLGARLVNASFPHGFSFSLDKTDLARLDAADSGLCLVSSLKAGAGLITIRHTPTQAEKEVLLVIANTREELEGLPYLSTTQNLITVNEGGSILAAVSIENFSPADKGEFSTGFTWEADSSTLISLVNNGSEALVKGLQYGTAKIKVSHKSVSFPLEIIVNVVNPRAAAAHPYITSPNIVTLEVGEEGKNIAAQLIGGSPADALQFSWTVEDPSLVELYASNDTAQVKALKPGVTQIIVRHPRATGFERSILVIASPAKKKDCVITLVENIIRMTPQDSGKTITATLTGGSAADFPHFKWWADDYTVIDLSYTGNAAVIKPRKTGQTTVHISHPKAAYDKELIVYISQYNEFAFERTSLSLKAGTKEFVNLEIPVYNIPTRVSYTSEKEDGTDGSSLAQASGTGAVCILEAHSEGTVIITARLASASSGQELGRAQLLVNIEKKDSRSSYIRFSGSTVLTLQKGATRTLRAGLVGSKKEKDEAASKKIQWAWKSSDTGALALSPASSQGMAVNDVIQVRGVASGECILTLSHGEAQELKLCVIVPGAEEARVDFDREKISMVLGDKPAILSASLVNTKADYKNLEWSIIHQSGNSPVVALSGQGGKKINIIARNIGTAAVRALHKPSGREALCEVEVRERPSLVLVGNPPLKTYPEQVFTLEYRVTPARDMDKIIWTTNNESLISCVDDKNGTLTVTMGSREGFAKLTGTVSVTKAKASHNIHNSWGNKLSTDKDSIGLPPPQELTHNDRRFSVVYTLEPASAYLRASFIGNNDKGVTPLLETNSSVVFNETENYYEIAADNHAPYLENNISEAQGLIQIQPQGEFNGTLLLEAYNPHAEKNPEGYVEKKIAEKRVKLFFCYPVLTWTPAVTATEGVWSHYDEAGGRIVIGDGETIEVNFTLNETNAQGALTAIELVHRTTAYTNIVTLPTQADLENGRITVNHNHDWLRPNDRNVYDPANPPGASADFNYLVSFYAANTTIVKLVPVGVIKLSYDSVKTGGEASYEVPLYLEVRYCSRDYQ